MDIRDEQGIVIAVVDADELDTRPWLDSERHIDLARVVEPPASRWDKLTALGFVRKPQMVSWKAELGIDEAEFLSRMDKKARYDVRRAQDLAERALRISAPERIEPELLDRFLDLYRERVVAMPFGVTIACRYRDSMLTGPERYYAIFAMDGDDLVGGCLVRECPTEDMVRIRFSAVTEHWRKVSLARTLYFAAMRTARRKGYKWVSLGDDPNLYGHVVKAGLFQFKVNMGFRCVPSQDLHDPAGRDVADLVLSLDRLTDPCLILGYPPDSADRDLTVHLISATQQDPKRFAAPFLAGVEPRLLTA